MYKKAVHVLSKLKLLSYPVSKNDPLIYRYTH